jgi:hypothetical protein
MPLSATVTEMEIVAKCTADRIETACAFNKLLQWIEMDKMTAKES